MVRKQARSDDQEPPVIFLAFNAIVDLRERSSLKMQKCEKCPHIYYSTINCRRHFCLHRRNLNLEKDSREKIWAELKAFWGKLSVDEAKKVVSLKDISLEGLSGSTIVKALLNLLSRPPGLAPPPQDYEGAGFKLLEIVLAKSSSFPISSEELFSILDEASEYTFLRAGTAESLLKYVIDGNTQKVALYPTNLIACTSLLVELKLVKACLDRKESDSLKMRNMLIEEEEAKQKKRAARSEKNRLKKLRQKEQRATEQARMEIVYPPCNDTPSAPTSSIVDEPACCLESTEVTDSSSPSQEPFDVVNGKGDTCEDYMSGNPDVEDVSCEPGELDCNLESAELTENSPPSQEPAQVVDEEVDVSKEHVRGYSESEDGRVASEPDCNADLEEVTDKSTPSQEPDELDFNMESSEITGISTPSQETAQIVDEKRILSEDHVTRCPNVMEDGSRVYVVLVGSFPVIMKVDQQRSDIRGGASEVCALNPTISGQSGLADPSTVQQFPHVSRHDSGSQLRGQNSPNPPRVGLNDEVLQTSLARNDPKGHKGIPDSPVDILKGGAAIERAWQFLRQRAKEMKEALHAGDPDVKLYRPEGSPFGRQLSVPNQVFVATQSMVRPSKCAVLHNNNSYSFR